MDRTMAGRRVRLIHCSDPYTELREGAEGTINFIDDVGTYHIRWDSGSTLGLIPGQDEWVVMP